MTYLLPSTMRQGNESDGNIYLSSRSSFSSIENLNLKQLLKFVLISRLFIELEYLSYKLRSVYTRSYSVLEEAFLDLKKLKHFNCNKS